MKRTLLVVLGTGLLLVACRASTDVNKTCTLVRGVDGGVVPITEGFVQEHTKTDKDFITFGSVDCEDLTCVRDSSFPKGADLNAPAKGYCTRQCAVGGLACTSFDETFDKDPATKLNCRSLLLDPATLSNIILDGGSASVGGAKDSYFCARGAGSTDGGQ